MSNKIGTGVVIAIIINTVWFCVSGVMYVEKEKREQVEKFVAFRKAVQTCATKDFPDNPAICLSSEKLRENRWSTCATQMNVDCMNRMQLILDSLTIETEGS